MNKEELYKFVLDNRMAYARMLRASNRKLYDEICNKYTGVKNSGESFWLYCHGHESTLKCECGAKLLFENVVSGYKSKECKPCYYANRKLNADIAWGEKLKSQPIDPPLCQNPKCNKGDDKHPAPVIHTKEGLWSNYCSIECRGQGNSTLSRGTAKQTWTELYGVGHHRQDPIKAAEHQETIRSRYGVDNVMELTWVREKMESTNIELYGSPCVFGSQEIRADIIKTNLAKFGCENPSQNAEVHSKKLKTSYETKHYLFDDETIYMQGDEPKIVTHLRQLYSRDDFEFNPPTHRYILAGKEHVYHPDFGLLGMVTEVKSDYTLLKEKEKNMGKFASVAADNELALFITIKKDIFSTVRDSHVNALSIELSKYGFEEYVIIDNKFFDFYCDLKKVAIRILDPRVHNEHLQDRNFFNSTNLPGVMGMYFTLEMLATRFDVVLRSIVQKMGVSSEYIHGRQCEVREVNYKTAKKFLDETHLQGCGNTSAVYLALFHNDEMVSCMTFNKQRTSKAKKSAISHSEVVLTRFSSKGRINGGASKLLAYYIEKYKPDAVTSYSDNMYSNGGLYIALGFELKTSARPDFKYSKLGSKHLVHKSRHAKGKIVNTIGYGPELSERDIAVGNGYCRTYDCGKKTWVLDLTK